MRINYRLIPTDYIEELQAKGKRLKARCFMEYFLDVQMDAVNSFGFYAKSWGGDRPMSKGTVHKWIKEFADEIDKFWSYHQLKNQQHYSSVKKQSERQVNAERTNAIERTPVKRSVSEEQETPSERRVNKALNINDDDSADRIKRRYLDDLYTIYRRFTKYAGSKEDAWNIYRLSTLPNHKQLTRSIVLYLSDRSVERKYNLANFLRNEIYLNYIEKRMRVMVDGEWITGVYDDERQVFTDGDGREYRLTPTRLAEKLADGELEFVIGDAA